MRSKPQPASRRAWELPLALLMPPIRRKIRRGALRRPGLSGTTRRSRSALDALMEGWRLTRVPRIDRHMPALGCVDLYSWHASGVPANESVELAKP